ncbi:penicillin acylase family protein [Pseudoalteromonas sp. T1lg65]|uniref:penicillin acylase family protein n=1 Tax=Pseudoalteromonas sp. T1lg65 TaxID=2077101 RepID=UPI003F793A50
MNRISVKLGVSCVLLIGIFVYFVHSYLFSPLAEYKNVELRNLEQKVEITTDEYGIPAISANSEHDLYFAMGYLHAQERLWQLELQRRLSKGTLSEVFGKSSVAYDAWIRTLNLHGAAESALKSLSPEAVASLHSYSLGINAFLNSNTPLPFEFELFGVEPEPWQPVDSLAWVKVFALNLSGNYKQEIQRLVARQYMGAEHVGAFFPLDPQVTTEQTVQANIASLSALLNAHLEMEQQVKVGGRYVGSNAWVVSGKHTKSGHPILANDPHLGLQIPSLWFAVKQQINEHEVAGASLVGLPVVVFGKNRHIAWGGTNMMADVQDLTVEKVNPENPNQYWYQGQWRDFAMRVDEIKVRSSFPTSLTPELKPVQIRVKETIHGPVISSAAEVAKSPVSLQWTALQNHDSSYETFYRLNKATNWQSFLSAVEHHVAPALNLFYIDSQGNIGFKGIGLIPVRETGDGRYPQARSDIDNNWKSFIPFSQMPEKFNPESGFLVNANNANVSDDYPFPISHEFAPTARADRIEQLIQTQIDQNKPLSLDYISAMQLDALDLSVAELRNVMLTLQGKNQQQIQALKQLQEWDMQATVNSTGATVYYTWYHHLSRYLLADETKGYWDQGSEQNFLSSLPALLEADVLAELLAKQSVWCDIAQTEVVEDCRTILESSLEKAIDDLTRVLGNNPEDWQLSHAQTTLYKHIPFSEMKFFDRIFERRIATYGAPNTVNAAGTAFDSLDGFEKNFGAGFRQIIEMSKHQQTHLFINSTGQSGQLASEHYDNMIERFEQNQLIELHKSSVVHQFQMLPKGKL